MPRRTKHGKVASAPKRTPEEEAQIKALGDRIREVRTALGWSQEECADNCGLDRSHMGEVERGEVDPQWTTMVKIIRGLAMQPGKILNVLFEKPFPPSPSPPVPVQIR